MSLRTRALTGAAVLLTATGAAVATAADPVGDAAPDPAFGAGGYVTAPAFADGANPLDTPSAMTVDPIDGAITIGLTRAPAFFLRTVGQSDAPGDEDLNVYATLARLTADGTPDAGFRFDGVPGDTTPAGIGEPIGEVLGESADSTRFLALARGPGRTTQAVVAVGGRYFAARWTDEGELDDTYSGNGIEQLNLKGSGCEGIEAAATRPDGSIVLLGDCAFGEPGAGDVTVLVFDPTGERTIESAVDVPGVTSVSVRSTALAADGGLLVGGAVRNLRQQDAAIRGVVFRVTATGTLVEAFGGGSVRFPERVRDVAITATGSPQVLLDPEQEEGPTTPLVVARLTSAGAADPAFGTAGRADTTLSSGTGAQMEVDATGRTYVAQVLAQVEIARLTDAGALDPTFGTAGVATYPVPSGARIEPASGFVTGLQPTGRLLVASRYTPSGAQETRAAGRRSVTRQATAPSGVRTPGAAVLRLAGGVPAPVTPATPAAPAAPGTAPVPVATQALPTVLPAARRCVSRRRFTIRLRPGNARLMNATVRVNGKIVAVRKGRRLTAPVDLRGLPKGRFTVRVDARRADGTRYREVRRYKTCGGTPGSNSGKVQVTRPRS